MPEITFVQPDGTKVSIDAPVGQSLMQIATTNDVDGIVGECGGNAMCATCHVYVEQGPQSSLPAIDESEDEMLDCTATERTDASRLSCQIRNSDALDGLVLRIPDTQV